MTSILRFRVCGRDGLKSKIDARFCPSTVWATDKNNKEDSRSAFAQVACDAVV